MDSMDGAQEVSLPRWASVLAVVAHPDDESFGLGAVISTFVAAGSSVDVLCFTAGESSTLGAAPDLAAVRADELRAAAAHLGCRTTELRHHPDGGLAERSDEVRADIVAAIDLAPPDGLLIFAPDGGVTGHPDHEAASRAALVVAEERGLPVLQWGLPEAVAAQLNDEFGATFTGLSPERLPITISVDREPQLAAAREHLSQAVPGSVLWRRLELLGDREHLGLA